MKYLGGRIEFIALHYEMLFAPRSMDYQSYWVSWPINNPDLEKVRWSLPEKWIIRMDEYSQNPFNTMRGPPELKRRQYKNEQGYTQYAYVLSWNGYGVQYEEPEHYNPKLVPDYLSRFTINTWGVRQAILSPSGCTYYALTFGHELWEVDAE